MGRGGGGERGRGFMGHLNKSTGHRHPLRSGGGGEGINRIDVYFRPSNTYTCT